MLLFKTRAVGWRVVAALVLPLAVVVIGTAVVFLGGTAGLWDWPPRPSSGFGVACGLVGGGIVWFELAFLARKWWRGRRLGATQTWLRVHVWLGAACLPIVLTHSGFSAGGLLPSVTLVLFLAVVGSGIWGLVMQQWLPHKIHADVPGETVASQVDYVGERHAQEAVRLIAVLLEGDVPSAATSPVPVLAGGGRLADRVAPLVVGQPAVDLQQFADRFLLPYLRFGRRSGSPLASRAEGERWFTRLREAAPPPAHPLFHRLGELCDTRRQWDTLTRLNRWLHNWMLVHTPLSVLMTGVMCVHAVRALKYW